MIDDTGDVKKIYSYSLYIFHWKHNGTRENLIIYQRRAIVFSEYRIIHKSVLITELELSTPSISLDIFLYNGCSSRPRLVFIPQNVQATHLGYKVFAEALIIGNSVRVSIFRSEYLELWSRVEGLEALIEKESLKIMKSL